MFSNREEINYSSVLGELKHSFRYDKAMLCQLQSIALLYSSIIPEIFRLCRRLRVYPHLFLSLSLLFCVSLIHIIFEHLTPVATMLIEILLTFGFINFEDSRNLLHILVVNSLFASQFQLFQNESRFLLRHIGAVGLAAKEMGGKKVEAIVIRTQKDLSMKVIAFGSILTPVN